MNIIEQVLGFIWGIWAICWFIMIALFFLPLTYLILKSPLGTFKAGHRITKIWAGILLMGLFVKVKRMNKMEIEKGKAYIFVSNHSSQLDIPIFIVSNPVPFKYLAKHELLKAPVIGFLVSKLYVTVDRRSAEGRTESLEKMETAVRNGTSVYIYPEGTRNRGPEALREFYDGAFKLSVKTGAPLVVSTILDSFKCLPTGRGFYMKPGVIKIYWEQPINPAGYEVEVLKEKARELILARIQASTGK